MNWTDKTKDLKIEHKFTPIATMTHTLPPTATSTIILTCLFLICFFETLSEQTNKYATQKQEATAENDKYWTTPDEIKIFVFIQYIFGIHHLPEVNMYWLLDPLLRVPATGDIKGRY